MFPHGVGWRSGYGSIYYGGGQAVKPYLLLFLHNKNIFLKRVGLGLPWAAHPSQLSLAPTGCFSINDDLVSVWVWLGSCPKG